MKMTKQLGKLVWWIRELLFPRRCPVCDEPVKPAGKKICRKCRHKLVYVSADYCMKCGKPLGESTLEFCRDCQKRKHEFVQGRSLYEYKSAAKAIYKFKYGNRREYAEFFGEELADKYRDVIVQWNAEAILPVPIHKNRKKKRGFNQSSLLAKELSKHVEVPVIDNFIVRSKDTTPLKELTGIERQNNLKKAFKIVRNDVKLSTIIILDDIYTTGSTVDEMARVLKETGIQKIYVLTLAIGAGM